MRVRNDGDRLIPAALLTAAFGKNGDPSDTIASPEAIDLQPGEDREIRTPFDLPSLAFGGYDVVGEVGIVGDRAPFATETSHWPWGLLVVAIILLQIVLLGVRNIARRRVARSASGRGRGVGFSRCR